MLAACQTLNMEADGVRPAFPGPTKDSPRGSNQDGVKFPAGETLEEFQGFVETIEGDVRTFASTAKGASGSAGPIRRMS